MSQYLVLIYGDENKRPDPAEGRWEDVMKGHMAFGETHEKAILGGEALQGTHTATSIRPKGSGLNPAEGFTVTDGPFAETKEALGGFYLLEAPDLDAAIKIAQDIPMPFGGVEVRPVQKFD